MKFLRTIRGISELLIFDTPLTRYPEVFTGFKPEVRRSPNCLGRYAQESGFILNQFEQLEVGTSRIGIASRKMGSAFFSTPPYQRQVTWRIPYYFIWLSLEERKMIRRSSVRTALSLCFAASLMACPLSVTAGDLTEGFEEGTIELASAGPLAFAPEGILLVGDAKAASLYAIDTGEKSGDPSSVSINVEELDKVLAGALGIDAGDVLINDLAVNPLSGTAYLSVSRGKSPDAEVVLLRIRGDDQIEEFSLKSVSHSVAKLPNAPEEEAQDRRGRKLRTFSITDISYVDNRVVIAGLSNEEFSSNLRALQFPFEVTSEGATVEVFHGAHGRYETNAPVRTFAPISINNEPFIVAAYTCTPLVRFPLSAIEEKDKLTGTTVAELGNRNNPLDMFVYSKGGEEFILMANSARGTMKISTSEIGRESGITERVSDTAGQTYETIKELEGVVQLDRLNEDNAIAVLETDNGMTLKTVKLP